MTDLPWIFTMTVKTPSMMRKPGLDDPDNWNVEGMDQDNWDSAELVADAVEKELAALAPTDVLIERDTKVSVRITTPTIDWFRHWYSTSPHADLVMMYQTPDRPALTPDGEPPVVLDMYDREGPV